MLSDGCTLFMVRVLITLRRERFSSETVNLLSVKRVRDPSEFRDIQVISGGGTLSPTQLKVAWSGDTAVVLSGDCVMLGATVCGKIKC